MEILLCLDLCMGVLCLPWAPQVNLDTLFDSGKRNPRMQARVRLTCTRNGG
nr:MAG TPA: hypothetical protein [Caudoviricetes sp.]